MLFDAFIGNRKIIERLRRKLREDRFPHGVIFSGPEGVGKHTCALMVAKALNCLKAEPGAFCDECSSCRKIQSGAHADLSTIGVEGEATQIKIAQVRLFLSTLELAPLEGRNKVAGLDGVRDEVLRRVRFDDVAGERARLSLIPNDPLRKGHGRACDRFEGLLERAGALEQRHYVVPGLQLPDDLGQ